MKCKPKAHFEVFQGANNEWFWRIRSNNGKITAIGGEGYTRKRDAVRATSRHCYITRTVLDDIFNPVIEVDQ